MTTSGETGSNSPEEDLVDSKQLAAKLNVSSRCVLYWEDAGIIQAKVRVGKVVRFSEREVMASLSKKTEESRGIPNKDEITHLALWQVAPDVVWEPSWALFRDPTSKELEAVGRLVSRFGKQMVTLEEQSDRLKFVAGAMAAAYFEMHHPSVE